MPTHALLGATGGTGKAILRSLQRQKSELQLNVLVRNQDKLLKAFPDLSSGSDRARPQIEIIEAGLDDQKALKRALAGAEVIYSCVASNESTHGMTVAIDTANAIIAALQSLRKEEGGGYKAPIVLMLRSANLAEPFAGPDPLNQSWNPVIMALRYLYADLEAAGKRYEAVVKENSDLLQYVIVDPVAIHDPDGAECTGYELSTDTKPAKPSISYADLGKAFCEIARRRQEFQGRSVMVAGTGKINEQWPSLLGHIASGAIERVKSLS